MRSAECDILVVPGLQGSGNDHWQTRWEQKLTTARRVEQDDWARPDCAAWAARVVAAVNASERPVILLAHSLGVATVAQAAPSLKGVAGAFLVAPPDVEREDIREMVGDSFAPLPRDPLPFPSLLIASRDDPYCAFDRAEDFAFAWGAVFLDAGSSGHINAESGHGPWPEGLMRFAGFLRQL